MIDNFQLTFVAIILLCAYISIKKENSKRQKTKKKEKSKSIFTLEFFRKIVKGIKTIQEFETASSVEVDGLSKYAPAMPRDVDSMARKTGWSPMGHNFSSSECTHELKIISPNKAKLKPFATERIFIFLIFFIIGIGFLSFGFILVLITEEVPFLGEIVAILFSTLNTLLAATIVFLLGVYAYIHLSLPIMFDKENGCFYKSRTFPKNISKCLDYKKGGKLNEIHSLQIINGLEKETKNDLPKYELNLIMIDASRVHLIEHGALKSMRRDAQKLAEFLSVPLWDATLQN